MTTEVVLRDEMKISIEDANFVNGNIYTLMLESSNNELNIEMNQDNFNELLRAIDQYKLLDRRVYDYDNPEFYLDEIIEEDGKKYFKTKEDKKLID